MAHKLKKLLSTFSKDADPKDMFRYSVSHVSDISALISFEQGHNQRVVTCRGELIK